MIYRSNSLFVSLLAKIENPHILGLIPPSEILGVPLRQKNRKSANFDDLSAIRKSVNLYEILHCSVSKQYLKSSFWTIFILYKFEQDHNMLCTKKVWVCKLQIRKVSHLRNVCKSNKPFKSANLRKLFADRPPLLSSHACEKTQKEGLFFALFFAKRSRKGNVFSGLSLLSLTGRNVTLNNQ
jgi:hypothetical protein